MPRKENIRRTISNPIRGKFNDAITLDDSELARFSEADIHALIEQREADYIDHIERASQRVTPESQNGE